MSPLVIVSFVCSFTFGPALQALADLPSPAPGHTRRLGAAEMRAIVGAQSQSGSTQPIDLDGGPSYPWQGSVGGTSTADGNKLTQVPIVGWTARGGLPVAFTLYHNSEGTYNVEVGQKWTHSYDIYLVGQTSGGILGPSGGDAPAGGASSGTDMGVHWGNDQCYTFTANIDGSYSAPTGIHDQLVADTDGSGTITSYDLTTPDQTKYHFTNPNGTGWYIATISDPNGNTITVNHNTSNLVTSIVDPTNRTITLGYTSGKLTSITDPLSRQWTISYNGSSELSQVTWPALNGTSYNEQFGYDTAGHHDITSWTDKRGHSSAFTYNSNDSLATETDACGNTTSFTYTSTTTTITDANSHSIVHTYSSGLLSSVSDAESHSESYGYDSANNRTSVTDKRGKLWQFTYDTAGNMLTKTDPNSNE